MLASVAPVPLLPDVYPLEPDATRSTSPDLQRDDRALQVEPDDDGPPIVVSFFAGLDHLFTRREVRHAG